MASPRAWLIGICVLCLAAVGAALVSQHRFDMQPCPWCVLQRLLFLVIAALALVAAFVPRPARQGLTALGVLAALAGAAAALYQHFFAAKSQSCNLTLADRIISGLRLDAALPDVFEVRASCADAATTLLGLAYEFWSLGLFAVIAAALVRLLATARR
jgi:protein dithiol:quinone oxidoreductase